MIIGIFTGHKNFAKETLNAVESIIGKQNNYHCISNSNKSLNSINNDIDRIILQNSDNEFIIFIDFFGSSLTVLATNIYKQYNNVHLFFGYNLPVVIDFFIHRKNKSVKELLEKLKQIALVSIKYENNTH